jgi:uncharacterized membrane protein
MKKEFARWQANFYTGLAIVLPAILSIAIVIWLFGSVTNVTNNLLFFLPFLLDKAQIFVNGLDGQMFWHWKLAALILAIFLIGLLGGVARLYFGRKLIQLMDRILLQVPLLNKIYGAIKQINEAFTNNNRSTFKQVALVEFPKAGVWSVGFITGDHHPELRAKTNEKILSVFVPTTPNPTTGFLVLLPEEKVTIMQMSVAEGVKYIMSLGSVAPAFPAPASAAGRLTAKLPPENAPDSSPKMEVGS